MKPFVGLAGTPRGVWPITDGVQLSVTTGSSGPTLALAVDATAWLAGAGRRSPPASRSASPCRPAAAPHPTVELFVGVPDGPAGTTTPQHRRAAHRSSTAASCGSCCARRPVRTSRCSRTPPASARCCSPASSRSCPTALNELAAMSGDAVRTEIAALVGSAGRGLALATGTPAVFDPDALKALAADPRRLPARAARRAADAGRRRARPVPRPAARPPGRPARRGARTAPTSSPSRCAPSSSRCTRARSACRCAARSPGCPSSARCRCRSPSTPPGWPAGRPQVGPAAIDLGGPVLRPFARVSYASRGGWQVDVGLGLDALGPDDIGHQELAARWRQVGGLERARHDADERQRRSTEDTTPGGVAVAAIDAVLDLVGGWVLGVPDVQTAAGPDRSARKTVRFVLEGSVLATGDRPPAAAAGRADRLARRSCSRWPGSSPGARRRSRSDRSTLGIANDGGVLGVSLNLANAAASTVERRHHAHPRGRRDLDRPAGPTPGIVVEILQVSGPTYRAAPGIKVDGVGPAPRQVERPADRRRACACDTVAVHLFGSVIIGSELATRNSPAASSSSSAAWPSRSATAAATTRSPRASCTTPAAAERRRGRRSARPSPCRTTGSGVGGHAAGRQRRRAVVPADPARVRAGVPRADRARRRLPAERHAAPARDDQPVPVRSGLAARADRRGRQAALRLPRHPSRSSPPRSWEVDVEGFAIAAELRAADAGRRAGEVPARPRRSPASSTSACSRSATRAYGIDLFGGYAHPTDAGAARSSRRSSRSACCTPRSAACRRSSSPASASASASTAS